MTQLEERIKKKLKDFEHSVNTDFPKKNLLIEVTNACNNKCIFCANRLMERKKSLIDPELVEKVLVDSYEL
jgi:MoaA/NifB/PqqE/SkfB family radical SAM enzyme